MSLLQMSFAGAVMILAITIIRALAISLLPKKTFLALWGIAVARLLLPFSLPSMFSVYSLIGNQTSGIAATKVPQIDKVLPIDTIGQMATMPSDIGSTASTVSIWGAVWAAGTLICAMVFAIAYWKCRQEFQTSLPVKNDFIKSWLNTHQLKRPISIRQSSRFSAPLTYGVFRPMILMPTSTDWENTKALQYVLAHEYIHIRRFDSITKLVLIAALCVHWFNPLVWVMYILANRDIELSCDEAVVRLFGETTKAAYARALISMEETRSGLTPLCNNFSKNAIEERITAIMKIKKASIFSLVLALALVVGVTTTAFATSSYTKGDDKGDYESGEMLSSSALGADANCPPHTSSHGSMKNYSMLFEYDRTTDRYFYDGKRVVALFDENVWDGVPYSFFSYNSDHSGDVIYLKTVRDKTTNEIVGVSEMTEADAEYLNANFEHLYD